MTIRFFAQSSKITADRGILANTESQNKLQFTILSYPFSLPPFCSKNHLVAQALRPDKKHQPYLRLTFFDVAGIIRNHTKE